MIRRFKDWWMKEIMILSNFENEHIGDIIDSDEEECSHTKSASVDVVPSMDTTHPSMDNISVDRHTSTDNSSSGNLNSFSRSHEFKGSFSKS